MDSTNQDSYSFLVGTIVGFRGIRGEIKVRPRTNNPSLLLPVESVEVKQEGKPVFRSRVAGIRLVKKLLVVTLADCSNRTEAEKLKGARLYTQERQLGELAENEWWVDDLIGIPVFSTTGDRIGSVSDVFGDEGEFLEIEISDSGKKALVPFVSDVVPVVDTDQRRVEVVVIPGLLD